MQTTGKASTHAAPRPLPVFLVTPALDLSSQFLALCLLAHDRCGPLWRARRLLAQCPGAPQPQEDGAAAPGAIRLVWDWVLHEAPPLRRACMRMGKHAVYGEVALYKCEALAAFAVSDATLGVVRGHTRHWVRDAEWNLLQVVGECSGHVVERIQGPFVSTDERGPKSKGKLYLTPAPPESQTPPPPAKLRGRKNGDAGGDGCGGVCELSDGCGGADKILLGGATTSMGVNHKWVVINERWDQERVVIVNLTVAKQRTKNVGCGGSQQQAAKIIRTPDKLFGVFMDEYHCDEAVFVWSIGKLKNVVKVSVVSLPQLWSSADDTASRPISSTRCLFPKFLSLTPSHLDEFKWLVMHTESGRRSFIATVVNLSPSFVLHYAESIPGDGDDDEDKEVANVTEYWSSRLELSQLSERLYCVSWCNEDQNVHRRRDGPPAKRTTKVEIWDCNFSGLPLRAVEFESDRIQAAFGHCGFLFHVNGDGDTVTVSDFQSGRDVAVITITGEKNKCRLTDHTEISFLF
ncbi:hypothetical protein Pelo_4431 [Pelomyxa schiedti]|nr:hypothetical protein Pelo_4431 [Pelomyxa schiedti]